jgi:ABC-type phosphate transport system substrate-binding protein
MKKSQILLTAMSLSATLLCASNALAQSTDAIRPESAKPKAYAPAENFYTSGSSAQFNTFGIAASYTIPPYSGPLCGSNHWSAKNSSSLPITIVDPRSSSILAEPANVWIAWDNNAQNGVSGQGVVCLYASVDSIVGVRAYAARATLSLAAGLVGTADANPDLVPLIGQGQALPQSIYNIVNGAEFNAANTDIRPEDAKFATMRVLTAAGTQVTGRGVTGLGYGPFPIGTSIQSSYSSTIANPVDFIIENGDTDPINSGNSWREYFDVPIGAAPVMVIANITNSASGHLGDGTFTNLNRFMLAKLLEGKITHTRDLNYQAAYPYVYPPTNYPDVPTHVYIREPLSGTYNTMEWSVPNSREIDADEWGPGVVDGQETGVTPSNTNGCTAKPCTATNVNGGGSGNPLYQVSSNGSTRGRAIGTGEMISAVSAAADSIGYAFWGFSTYQGKTALKYLTVDGVDPLYSGPSANPNGVGVLPGCTTSGGYATSCPVVPFPNIVNGTYPIWSKYRLLWDPYTASTNIAATIVRYAQQASEPGTGIITDFLPADDMQTFHSHYAQVVEDSGIGQTGNNGFKTNVPETGGDMGGAVLTIQSELDYLNDTGGNQQVNQQQ